MFLTEIITFLENTLIHWQVISPTTSIQHWLVYVVLFFVTIIEGPIATLTAAAISATGNLNPFIAFAFAATGNMTADICYYLIGKLGRFEMISWVLRKIRMDQEKIEQLKEQIIKNSSKTIFVAKITNSLIIPMLIMIGTIRIPVKRWMPSLLLGELIWSSFLMVAGYYFSSSIQQIESGSKYIGYAIGIIIIVVAIFLVRRSFRQQQQKKLD